MITPYEFGSGMIWHVRSNGVLIVASGGALQGKQGPKEGVLEVRAYNAATWRGSIRFATTSGVVSRTCKKIDKKKRN